MRKIDDNNVKAFCALLQAGLWEQDVRLSSLDYIDYTTIQEIAECQSVVGLIAAGLEHVVDCKPAKKDVLQFIGQALQLEQRNLAMNYFIGIMVEKMSKADIYTILVKGQGIAQCYERPLWRSCGDVDLLISDDNYLKAKGFLIPLASSVEPENIYEKHQGMAFDPWVLELHGNLYCGLSRRIERGVKDIQSSIFYGGRVRSWMNDNTKVFLPKADEDVLIIFTHFLKHFYRGGICLRQICDWCRVLWKYRETIDSVLLEKRVRKMGLMSEWLAFAALAVDWLGMPVDAMPLYRSSPKWNKKAEKILDFILFSANNEYNSYYFQGSSFFKRKWISFKIRLEDLVSHSMIFPGDSLKFLPYIMYNGLKAAISGYKQKGRDNDSINGVHE